MHSFHRSRGRILFEVLCALTVSASCVGAWQQTGASALLTAAAVAALYGLVHAFDLRRGKLAEAVRPQPIGVEAEFVSEVPVLRDKPEIALDAQGAAPAVSSIGIAEPVEPAPVLDDRPAKARRKTNGRRAKAPKEAGNVELALSDETSPTESASLEEAEVPIPTADEDSAHIPLEPLFEPESFLRRQQLRAGFGRKAG